MARVVLLALLTAGLIYALLLFNSEPRVAEFRRPFLKPPWKIRPGRGSILPPKTPRTQLCRQSLSQRLPPQSTSKSRTKSSMSGSRNPRTFVTDRRPRPPSWAPRRQGPLPRSFHVKRSGFRSSIPLPGKPDGSSRALWKRKISRASRHCRRKRSKRPSLRRLKLTFWHPSLRSCSRSRASRKITGGSASASADLHSGAY